MVTLSLFTYSTNRCGLYCSLAMLNDWIPLNPVNYICLPPIKPLYSLGPGCKQRFILYPLVPHLPLIIYFTFTFLWVMLAWYLCHAIDDSQSESEHGIAWCLHHAYVMQLMTPNLSQNIALHDAYVMHVLTHNLSQNIALHDAYVMLCSDSQSESEHCIASCVYIMILYTVHCSVQWLSGTTCCALATGT